MDDLTVAKACAKALGIKTDGPFPGIPYALWIPEGGPMAAFSPLTDPAIAFRLVGWLAERGTIVISRSHIAFLLRGGDVTGEDYTTTESRIAAVARIVARVMEEQG